MRKGLKDCSDFISLSFSTVRKPVVQSPLLLSLEFGTGNFQVCKITRARYICPFNSDHSNLIINFKSELRSQAK